MEGAMMARYFQSLAQAEKHVYKQKFHPRCGNMQWCIIDCTIGYLVVSVAQATHCFPALSTVRSRPGHPPRKPPEKDGRALV
jgi:hypothetical protein